MLEARVNFYVEAVKGYDDTTDCSVVVEVGGPGGRTSELEARLLAEGKKGELWWR